MMIRLSWRKLAAACLSTSFAFVAWAGAGAASAPAAQAAAQSTEASSSGQSSAQNDRAPWRQLKRHMSKDDVRKLLGEPARISVSRFDEEWDYPRGTIMFDGKGRLDAWSEL
jgi:outer membrane protein assembly factor BamE (lipoprotein component of BamABCDE complex)